MPNGVGVTYSCVRFSTSAVAYEAPRLFLYHRQAGAKGNKIFSLSVDKLFEDLVSADVYQNTMSLLSKSLDKENNSTRAFIEAVFYAEKASQISKRKIERSLSLTLIGIFEDDDNPFKEVIGFVFMPWHTKIIWRWQAFFKTNKKAITITTITLLSILILTNPSPTSYRQHVSLKYNISERMLNYRIITARKANYFIFSIYGNNRNGLSIGILGNFFDF